MSRFQIAAIIALVMIAAYSAIMIATAGTAPFAWVILVTAIGLLAVTARRASAQKSEGPKRR